MPRTDKADYIPYLVTDEELDTLRSVRDEVIAEYLAQADPIQNAYWHVERRQTIHCPLAKKFIDNRELQVLHTEDSNDPERGHGEYKSKNRLRTMIRAARAAEIWKSSQPHLKTNPVDLLQLKQQNVQLMEANRELQRKINELEARIELGTDHELKTQNDLLLKTVNGLRLRIYEMERRKK